MDTGEEVELMRCYMSTSSVASLFTRLFAMERSTGKTHRGINSIGVTVNLRCVEGSASHCVTVPFFTPHIYH